MTVDRVFRQELKDKIEKISLDEKRRRQRIRQQKINFKK